MDITATIRVDAATKEQVEAVTQALNKQDNLFYKTEDETAYKTVETENGDLRIISTENIHDGVFYEALLTEYAKENPNHPTLYITIYDEFTEKKENTLFKQGEFSETSEEVTL